MFSLGTRKITRQGGSCLISLPMLWMLDMGIKMKKVKVEMDDNKTLHISPVEAQ